MALVNTDSLNTQLQNMSRLPAVRQVGLLLGLAASIALGVSVVMWSQSPNYGILYTGLSGKDAADVTQALDRTGIAYKVDGTTGDIMVPATKVRDARLKLAAQGLPHSSTAGFDIMEKQEGFGTSQFLERARYQRAMEGELARTIMGINTVEDARVHLAVPKESAFIRNRKKPSASVMVKLYSGRNLEKGQVAAIVHLVASGIPNLAPSQVTVVDQNGDLLTGDNNAQGGSLNAGQLDYTHQVEHAYIDKIQNILSPIIGASGVRAQVVADMDFTRSEQTQETYNPDLPAVRSEQKFESSSPVGAAGAGGIPGALSNQPPGGGSAPQQTAATANNPNAINNANNNGGSNAGGANGNNGGTTKQSSSSSPRKTVKRSTMNYELDKTISHTRRPVGQLRRLSVAVVVDDKQTVGANGKVERKPRTPQELARITSLVKDAVGFSAQRGDTVNVINASFTQPVTAKPLPSPPLWKQAWVWDVGKQALGVGLVILMFFGLLRPVMRALASRPVRVAAAGGGPELAEDQLSLSGGSAAARLPSPNGDYEASLNAAKGFVNQDPKRVAQVVKHWVTSES